MAGIGEAGGERTRWVGGRVRLCDIFGKDGGDDEWAATSYV